MPATAQIHTNDENARYKRAIRAAEELFKKLGFRAVTMELVAREADVAKATLYSYFKNKDELYLAVCARMAGLMRGGVEQALAATEPTLDERLAEAVVSKHRWVFTLVRGSAHSAELYSYTHSMAGEVFSNLNDAIVELLSQAIATDPALGQDAKRSARALYYGSSDLANRCTGTADMEEELRVFVLTYLAGIRALAKPI